MNLGLTPRGVCNLKAKEVETEESLELTCQPHLLKASSMVSRFRDPTSRNKLDDFQGHPLGSTHNIVIYRYTHSTHAHIHKHTKITMLEYIGTYLVSGKKEGNKTQKPVTTSLRRA